MVISTTPDSPAALNVKVRFRVCQKFLLSGIFLEKLTLALVLFFISCYPKTILGLE